MLLNKGKAGGVQIVKPGTLELMTSSQIGDIPYTPGQTFGLGFGVLTATPESGIGSKGLHFWSGAYSTFFFVSPEDNMFAVLMTQRSPYTGKYGEAMFSQRVWLCGEFRPGSPYLPTLSTYRYARSVTEIRLFRNLAKCGTSWVNCLFVLAGITMTSPLFTSKSRKPFPPYGRNRNIRESPWDTVTIGLSSARPVVESRCLPM